MTKKKPKPAPAAKTPRRNLKVEEAVQKALERIDDFISGEELALPNKKHRRACEDLLDNEKASARTAAMFLMFYWRVEPAWDCDSVPVGARGQHGDKKLCEQLSERNITLHSAITAFGENLGWKGNVRRFKLSTDPRFSGFLAQVADAKGKKAEIAKIADFFAQRFAASKRETPPLPPVGPDVLTFVRAKVLFHHLLAINSEGHIQQFLIAGLLHEYRRRHAVDVATHHPHAADQADDTAGDIEERRDGELIRAYEVTVRDDWKNRISRFRAKMDHFKLSKYVIIAGGVNADDEWKVPATMALKLEPYGRDIAVVDILDVVHFLAAELTPAELRGAVNQAYNYLSDRKLSDRPECKEAYTEAVRAWLDTVPTPADTIDTPAEGSEGEAPQEGASGIGENPS